MDKEKRYRKRAIAETPTLKTMLKSATIDELNNETDYGYDSAGRLTRGAQAIPTIRITRLRRRLRFLTSRSR